MSGANWKLSGKLQISIYQYQQENHLKELYIIIKEVNKIAMSKSRQNGLTFKNRKGKEYIFDNKDEYDAQDIAPVEMAPFPYVNADVPRMLTERDEILGVDKVVQDDNNLSDEEWAMFAAANSGIDFLPDEIRY